MMKIIGTICENHEGLTCDFRMDLMGFNQQQMVI